MCPRPFTRFLPTVSDVLRHTLGPVSITAGSTQACIARRLHHRHVYPALNLLPATASFVIHCLLHGGFFVWQGSRRPLRTLVLCFRTPYPPLSSLRLGLWASGEPCLGVRVLGIKPGPAPCCFEHQSDNRSNPPHRCDSFSLLPC